MLSEAEGGLELCTYGEDAGAGFGEADGEWGVASGTTDRGLVAGGDAEDGVIARDVDVAVVEEEGVGDVFQTGKRIVVSPQNRRVAEVAGGHHERAGGLEQEGVKAGVGQHDADLRVAGGDLGGEGGVFAAAKEDDGACVGLEGVGFGVRDRCDFVRCVDVPHHDGEGLGPTVLALAQALDGALVGGVDGEVEAADAFDGDDLTIGEGFDGGLQGGFGAEGLIPQEVG